MTREQDADLVRDENETPYGDAQVVVLLRSAADATLPITPDGAALAQAAVRRVRARRTVLGAGVAMVAVGALVLGLHVGPLSGTGAARAMPGRAAATVSGTAVSPSAAASPSTAVSPSAAVSPRLTVPPAPVDGMLPTVPGFAHGVVEQKHSEYTMRGGLRYTLPPGVWTLDDIEHVDASKTPPSMLWYADGTGATIQLDTVADAAGWHEPRSGAWTADVPGADLVLITRGPVKGSTSVVRWDVKVRRGDVGWTMRLVVPDDAESDGLAAAFVGNLWFPADGEPDWFEPTFRDITVEDIGSDTPAGWKEVTLEGLTFAVPADWTTAPQRSGDALSTVQLEGDVASRDFELADGSTEDLRWRVLAEDWGPAPVGQDCCVPSSQEITVPGAALASVSTMAGPFWGDDTVRSYMVTAELYQAGGRRHMSLVIDLPVGDEGMALLRGILGSARFS